MKIKFCNYHLSSLFFTTILVLLNFLQAVCSDSTSLFVRIFDLSWFTYCFYSSISYHFSYPAILPTILSLSLSFSLTLPVSISLSLSHSLFLSLSMSYHPSLSLSLHPSLSLSLSFTHSLSLSLSMSSYPSCYSSHSPLPLSQIVTPDSSVPTIIPSGASPSGNAGSSVGASSTSVEFSELYVTGKNRDFKN